MHSSHCRTAATNERAERHKEIENKVFEIVFTHKFCVQLYKWTRMQCWETRMWLSFVFDYISNRLHAKVYTDFVMVTYKQAKTHRIQSNQQQQQEQHQMCGKAKCAINKHTYIDRCASFFLCLVRFSSYSSRSYFLNSFVWIVGFFDSINITNIRATFDAHVFTWIHLKLFMCVCLIHILGAHLKQHSTPTTCSVYDSPVIDA